MANRTIRPILYERFGTYNNLRSNPYSDSEKILDVRSGVLDPYTQIVQSALQNSYTVDSLSVHGNTFRARVLGVIKGRPARHLYPELYANSRVTPDQIPEYFIFSLRDETDQFAPDPLRYAGSVQSYVNMIGLQGRAISEKPANETIDAFGRGDIVEVYKPEQNSWNGAVVRKVVVRNNFENFLIGSNDIAAELFGGSAGQPFNNGSGQPNTDSFTPRVATAADVEAPNRLGTQADWEVFSPGVVYPPGSQQLVDLFTEAAIQEGLSTAWARLPGLTGASRDITGGGLVSRESAGVVGRLNYEFENVNDPKFNFPEAWNDGKNPANIEYAIRQWIQSVPPASYIDGDETQGVLPPQGVNSTAIGLGQLLSSTGYNRMPNNYGGYGIPIAEARGMLRYIYDRYGHPNSAYSFHNFPPRYGERVYYIGNPGFSHTHPDNKIVVRDDDGNWVIQDTGEVVPGYDFILDQADPPNRVRTADFFRGARLGQITSAGYDEYGRPEVKAHEGY